MHENLIDLKVFSLAMLYAFVQFADCEIIMKITAFVLTIGYTLRRWYFLEKNNKDD
jgi:hypothetical protein